MYQNCEMAMAMGYNVEIEDILKEFGITKEEYEEAKEE